MLVFGRITRPDGRERALACQPRRYYSLASGDETMLAKYNRFLQPMLEILLARETEPGKAQLIRRRLSQPYAPLAPAPAAAVAARN